MLTFADIEAARRRIGDAVYVSPCAFSRSLSVELGCQLYLKLENLQMTGSFKERGACNKLSLLTEEERRHGVVTASAGNHAQGVAYHARQLDIRAVIVMPALTPLMKVSATRRFGAEVVLHGNNYDEAAQEAARLQEEHGYTYVHPFEDPAIMAGQGTIGLELLEQNPYLEAIVVAVGGGGLAAGVATAVKETNPKIRVYGVEAASVPSMRAAMDAGSPVEVPAAKTIADGIAVRRVGKETHAQVARYLDDLVAVDEEEIAEAILVLLEREKTVAEGAGAAPLAALLQRRLPVEGKKTAAIVCGGNIDVNVIARIIDRGLLKTGRLWRVRVCIPDVPGSLAGLLGVLSDQGANVLQVRHDRVGARVSLGDTVVGLELETRGFDHIDALGRAIRDKGYEPASE
ncbi:MAG TPA: threonine ammonia-lyase [Polyangiaceae bacterium LLY-WYZ-14_1]|jgi:threonine dehydratase|nr:threonine ammonia-lyase [Polyangiaceae bacterium LLY-WYZ-14_1]